MQTNTQIDEERMNNAVKTLKKWRNDVNRKLNEEYKQYKETTKKLHPEGERMIEYIEDYTMRSGKRVRPACIIAGYKGVGGKDHEKILSAAISIESLESYFIIHDDIYDKDELRRGKDTVYKMYEKYHEKELVGNDPKHFGITMGIIAGNIACSQSFDQLMRSDFDLETKMKALKKLEYINQITNYGQALDNVLNNKDLNKVTEKDSLAVYANKTAPYTIAGPLELGAILGNGTEEQIETLKEYGMNIGKAFQTYDDLLGLYGDKDKTGKPVDSDLKEGKRTLVMVKALEMANEEQKKILKNALGNESITEQEINQVRQTIKDTGAYDYTQKKLQELINKGKGALENSEVITKESKDFLLGIADYIIAREV